MYGPFGKQFGNIKKSLKKICILFDPLLGIHPKETILNIGKALCSITLIAMLFINTGKWKIMPNLKGMVNYAELEGNG